jgi:hypothetical protein
MPRLPGVLALLLLAVGLGGLLTGTRAEDPPPAGPAGSAPDPEVAVWPRRRPTATLLLTGRHAGKFKPCGCTKPQEGGLERLGAVIDLLKRRADGALAPLGLGGSMAPPSPFARQQAQGGLKAQLLRACHEEMGFQACVLGLNDLYVREMVTPFGGPDEASAAARPRLPLNVLPTAQIGVDPQAPMVPWAEFRLRSLAVRVLSVVDEAQGESLKVAGLAQQVIPPAAALQQGLSPNAEVLWVVAVDGGGAALESVVAAMRLIGPSVIVDMTGVASDGPRDGVLLKDGPLVVSFDEKGKAVGVLDLDPAQDGKGWTASYCAQRLLPDFEAPKYESPLRGAASGWFDVYRGQVKEQGLLAMEERRPEAPGAPRYVGSAACAACHSGIYQDWLATPHSHALRTLKRVDYAWDPECLVCHVQGPTRLPTLEFVWAASGFVDPDDSPHLGSVGCENCHGPGSAHVAAPWDRELWKVGGPNRRTPQRTDCDDCHDLENSVGFVEQFAERLPKVDHRKVPKARRTHEPASKGGGGRGGR